MTTNQNHPPMRKFWIWVAFLIVSVTVLYLVKGILLPFVAGLLVAYVLNPLAMRLEKIGLPRGLGTASLILLFFLTIGTALFFTIPFLKRELLILAQQLPAYGDRLYNIFLPFFEEYSKYFNIKEFGTVRETASAYFRDMLSWGFQAIAGLLSNSLALANLLSLVILTPVISFYLLRDWPTIMETVNKFLPRDYAETIREQSSLINKTLGGYIRGQGLVCLILALFYVVGLSLTGLNFAITIGIATGFLAFIPYIGFLIGASIGIGIALTQFQDWESIGWVSLVFAIGTSLESFLLAPNLIGPRIGLHPVWIIFSLLAGGILFGFMGIMLAVPVAAAAGVLIRFFLSKYLKSSLYKGHQDPKKA